MHARFLMYQKLSADEHPPIKQNRFDLNTFLK